MTNYVTEDELNQKLAEQRAQIVDELAPMLRETVSQEMGDLASKMDTGAETGADTGSPPPSTEIDLDSEFERMADETPHRTH